MRVAMLPTYKAILRDNHVEWIDGPPDRSQPTPVQITLLEETPSVADRGKAMAEALEKVAQAGAFSEIEDPVTWQRKIRKDRPLPGRKS